MTLHAYQTLYESSIAFGIRKALQAEQVSNWPHSMTGLSYECGLVRNQKLFPFLMFNESRIVLCDLPSTGKSLSEALKNYKQNMFCQGSALVFFMAIP